MIIEARGISHRFTRHGPLRVEDATLVLAAGESVGLVGESGSGKTTLARIMLGTERPREGTVTRPPTPPGARASVAMLHQDVRGSMDPRYTVARIVAEASPLEGRRERRAQAADLLDLVGLDRDILHRHPHQLSGGQRQRVALARALASGASVLLLDEPTSALDAHVRLQIVDLLGELRRSRGLTLLVISHDFQVVERLCERVAVMLDGAIVEEGDVTGVLANPRQPYTAALVKASHMNRDRAEAT